MLAKPIIMDGQLQRQVQQGDVLAGGDVINSTLVTAGNGTILASQVVSGILNRTGPVGAFTDTTDSAANIISGFLGQYAFPAGPGSFSFPGVQQGTTFRLRYINSVAFAMTLAAGLGVTLGANVNVAASSVKEYLFTIINGAQGQVYVATTTAASAIITGLLQGQTNNLSPGMTVTGSGIPASTTVLSVQSGAGVTLSANATVTATLVALTFGPQIRIDSLGQLLL